MRTRIVQSLRGKSANLYQRMIIGAVSVALASVVAAWFISGPLGAGLALAGSLLGLLNLWTSAGALRRAPALFVGASLPRLMIITVLVLLMVLLAGRTALWAMAGLLAFQLTQIGIAFDYAYRVMGR